MLETIAWVSLALAFVCSVVIAIDEIRHPQKMWIMNIVWPVTALYFSVFALWAYFGKGRSMSKEAMQAMSKEPGRRHMGRKKQPAGNPTWSQTALAGSHCGAGCVLADIVTEFTVFGTGATVLGMELYASYLWGFVAAWLLGIVFQYFTIKPVRNLSVGEGISAAIKADTLSILTFQIGMYGWMALAHFRLFATNHLHPNQAGYWLMMQAAMICGFITALPVNWLLVKIGWKEAMG
ncbi:MAG TPA: DUF4396 domain-containing protein [Acidobacteriaceae bacterium]|jgi:hypothetical protein